MTPTEFKAARKRPGWTFSTTVSFRIVTGANALLNRLPAPLRPPEDKSGDGRRAAFLSAGFLSALACVIALLVAILRVRHFGFEPGWWDLRPLGAIVAGYFVGFYLAGWVWDALRPIHHRFIGYVLRWGLSGALIYGAIAVMMPVVDKDHMSLTESLLFVGVTAGCWALIGTGHWLKDRLWPNAERG